MNTTKEPLIRLKDGDIVTFREDHAHSNGCQTCDYGSSYVQDFTVVPTDKTYRFNLSQMYEYPISHDFLFKSILPALDRIKGMTIAEFIAWLKSEFESAGDDSARNLCDFEIEMETL